MSQLAVVVVRASVNANPHCPARDQHTFVSTGPQAKPFQRRDDMHACTWFLVLAHAVIRHRGLPSARFSVDEPKLCTHKTGGRLPKQRRCKSEQMVVLEAGIGAHILLTDGRSRALPCAALRQWLHGRRDFQETVCALSQIL